MRERAERRRRSQAALRRRPASPRSSPPCLAAGPSMVMADGPKHLQRGPVRVGFYDIEGTLGKGNFAVVKLGRHRITKTEVRPGARRERPRRGSGGEELLAGSGGCSGVGGLGLWLRRGAWDCEDPGGAGGSVSAEGLGARSPRPECRPVGNLTGRGFAFSTPPPWPHGISPRASHPGRDLICGLRSGAQVPRLPCFQLGVGWEGKSGCSRAAR